MRRPIYANLLAEKPAWFKDNYASGAWGQEAHWLGVRQYLFGANIVIEGPCSCRLGGVQRLPLGSGDGHTSRRGRIFQPRLPSREDGSGTILADRPAPYITGQNERALVRKKQLRGMGRPKPGSTM